MGRTRRIVILNRSEGSPGLEVVGGSGGRTAYFHRTYPVPCVERSFAAAQDDSSDERRLRLEIAGSGTSDVIGGRQPADALLNQGRRDGREAEAHLVAAGAVDAGWIEDIPRHEDDAGFGRVGQQIASIDIMAGWTPEVEPTVDRRDIERAGLHVPADGREQRVVALAMGGAQGREVLVVGALGQELGDDQLLQTRAGDIDALLANAS